MTTDSTGMGAADGFQPVLSPNPSSGKAALVFLSFGSEARFHLQTYFAIVSALRFTGTGMPVILYTDRPWLYKRLSGRIETVDISAGLQGGWLSDTGYVYTTKIQAIIDFSRRFPDLDMLFVDCDTVVTSPLGGLAGLVASGKGVMHVKEKHPSVMYRSQRRMWKALGGRTIGGTTITMNHVMWNSGVVGIPSGLIEPIASHALAICKFALDAKLRCLTVEQYAFSIAMQERLEMFAACDVILHYWGNKQFWLPMIAEFVQKSHFEGLTLDEEIERLRGMDFSTVPLHIKKSRTRSRLEAFLSRLFPDKVIR